jgi:hypothetical protein
MTTVSVIVEEPDRSSLVDRLAGSVLDRRDAVQLYEAMTADVCRAIERSGADGVLAVLGDEENVPNGLATRMADVLEEPDAVEVVSREATDHSEALAGEVLRLHEEGVTSAAVVEPSTPFLARKDVDSASMKLRSSEVVLGPAPGGRVHFAGFAEPIDLGDRFSPPAIERLAELTEEGYGVDFLAMLPLLESERDLPTVIAHLRARVAAGRFVPQETAVTVADLELAVRDDGGELRVVREETP